ncbi:MAG TPA: response regulator [Actinomycetes bacterium]|nr:response regulator [Actinomycetes bacterium]
MARILVVDDDNVSRLVLAHSFRATNHEVTEADSLGSALAACRHDRFDVVLTDYLMPDGSGLDLLAALGDADGRPKVVLVTGTSTRADLRDARVDGVDAYITKPFRRRELLACVEELLVR